MKATTEANATAKVARFEERSIAKLYRKPMQITTSTGSTVTDATAAAVESGPFDEGRIRLDHLAFRVANRDELERWATHLEAKGVHPDIEELTLDAGN
jgi:catechol 2,3-dioxygenase-like lactoylglutathione lyase family enzyme